MSEKKKEAVAALDQATVKRAEKKGAGFDIYTPQTGWTGSGKATGSATTKASGYATTGYGVKTCTHDGSKVAWKAADGSTFAGTRGGSLRLGVADLVIDFAGLVKSTELAAKVTGPERYVKVLAPYIRTCDLLRVEWPDMTAPEQYLEDFWIELRKAIPPKTRVVCACIGSHGRTGTGLAALWLAEKFLAGEKATATDAVAMIRSKHCKDAVETQGQENYLAALSSVLASRLDPKVDAGEWFKRDVDGLDAIWRKREKQKNKAQSTLDYGKGSSLVPKDHWDEVQAAIAEKVGMTADKKGVYAGDVELLDLDDPEENPWIVVGDVEKIERRKLTGTAEIDNPEEGVIYIDDANYEWMWFPSDAKDGDWVEVDEIEFVDEDDLDIASDETLGKDK